MRPIFDPVYRVANLRGIVDCASWPSGDSMQGALFATFMIQNMHRFVAATSPLFFYSIPFQTAFARIFFQCHYIGDVVCGTFLGALISIINTWIGETLVG